MSSSTSLNAPGLAESTVRTRRESTSVGTRLFAVVLGLVLVIVAVLAVYLPSRQIDRMRVELEQKATTYGKLVSKQVESAIAFDDQQTAREVFDATAEDADVQGLSLFKAGGDLLTGRGELSAVATAAPRDATIPHLVRTRTSIAIVAPVVSLEGPRGTLVLELSTRRLENRRREVWIQAAIAGSLALGLGALGAFWIARSLSQRLGAITRVASAVAGGDLDQSPVEDRGPADEIGVVTTAFNSMLGEIRALIDKIQATAKLEQTRLESLVKDRTALLDRRNEDMRLILDNVGQGFVTLKGRQGVMSQERSRVIGEWFGAPPESERFADYLDRADPALAGWFQPAWDAVWDDFLPLELALEQLPRHARAGDKAIELDYRAILSESGQLDSTARPVR